MVTEDNIKYETGHMCPGDNDHLVPPPYFFNRDLSLEDVDVQVVTRGEGRPTVITFGGSGLNPETGLAMYSMQNFLKDSLVNVVLLRDQFTCWFHRGISGVSTDVASTVQFLQRLIRQFGSDRVLCTGSSAGGYAAILFGVLLNASVVALNPQTLLKRGVQCQAHGYLYLLRWTDGEGTWDFTKRPQYADLLDLPPSESRIDIIYGADDPVDIFHAERLGIWPNVRLEKHTGMHGTTIVQARDTGVLAQLFSDVLAMPVWRGA